MPVGKATPKHFYGRWFPDATGNACYNCVDRHVLAGHGDRTALIHDSPVTDTVRHINYADLLEDVAALATVMQDLGTAKGDRVIIYMPMVPEAITAMLACARIGAVHSVVFGGFAALELATRIDDAEPTLIILASCGIEPSRIVEYKPLLDNAIELSSHKPAHCIVLQREIHRCELIPSRDVDYASALIEAKAAGSKADCVEVAATDPA